ncbi:hypothetical protein UFOVP726_40 [uncultured Caudovirales phage]|uniref:Uncharacterized protein n=1 Tax=uncultured Caudovirales phage TaxID=2100421 RepID=A0A6J5NM53_9CAUD|nr:hypothetical protein UFOVP726_40 [uncultured Caudovirales phage]
MTAPATLSEAWTHAQADAPIDPRATPAVQGKRDFMAGALNAILLHESGVPLQTIKAECVAFGRAIGTPAERA